MTARVVETETFSQRFVNRNGGVVLLQRQINRKVSGLRVTSEEASVVSGAGVEPKRPVQARTWFSLPLTLVKIGRTTEMEKKIRFFLCILLGFHYL